MSFSTIGNNSFGNVFVCNRVSAISGECSRGENRSGCLKLHCEEIKLMKFSR